MQLIALLKQIDHRQPFLIENKSIPSTNLIKSPASIRNMNRGGISPSNNKTYRNQVVQDSDHYNFAQAGGGGCEL